MGDKISVVIVDDSLMFRTFLQNALAKDASLEIIAVFADPIEAIEQIPRLRPDVVTVDMEMPKMRGNEFLRRALPASPGLKAVVISSLGDNVFDAMQAGATDFVGKPGSSPGYTNTAFIIDIIEHIKIAAKAHRMPHSAAARRPAAPPSPVVSGGASLSRVTPRSIIAIGASTGGTEAILEVVRQLPKNAPGVVVVQHMPPGFTNMYAERIDKLCAMTVREARDKDRVERGLILIAPGGDEQMRVNWAGGGYVVSLTKGQKVSGHCPSVDVLFDSVAASGAGANSVGIIMTGMGSDGAQGLKKMRQAGAYTIGQNEETCVVYGMPKVAYDIGGVADQQPLGSIAQATLKRF